MAEDLNNFFFVLRYIADVKVAVVVVIVAVIAVAAAAAAAATTAGTVAIVTIFAVWIYESFFFLLFFSK